MKTGARSRGRKENVCSLESISDNQLEQKDEEGAQRIDLDRDEQLQGSADVSRRFIDDFFAYIFNRDGEEDEPQEEDAHLVDLSVDSDEDGSGNSTAAVIEREDQPQRRLPRRAQPSRLPEAATDWEDEEDEDEDSSDDEDSFDDGVASSSRRSAVKTGARSRGRKGNVYSLEIITFSQLERKDKDAAQRVLDYYKDERQQCSVHVCSLFISGKCRYMSKVAREVSKHIKCHHPNAKHPGYKITQYPGFKDCKTNDFVTKSYPELKKTDPKLADEVLALYTRPQNKKKQKVHLCGYFVRGKCQYFSTNTGCVKSHMARNHSRTLPIIKIVGYPGTRGKTFYQYDQMTYAELKSKKSDVADEVLKYYYDRNCRQKVHLCGACDYFSYNGKAVLGHIASFHSSTTACYKIIEYPRLELD